MKTLDIHAHLQHDKFKGILDDVIKQAKERMYFIIVSGANIEWNREALRLAASHSKFIYATLGLHPCDAIEMNEKRFAEELEFIKKNRRNIVGVGEVGLDYHWVHEKDKQLLQIERFRQFIGLAKEINKPLIIHSWDADLEAIKILREGDASNVIMHCFSGKGEVMKEALNAGFYISFSTQILFSKTLRKNARDCPIEKMFIETDAPYLDPNRGTNMPWNTLLAAEKIAEIKKTEAKEVVKSSLANSRKIFGIRIDL